MPSLRGAGGDVRRLLLAALCAALVRPAAAAPQAGAIVLRFLGNEGFSIEVDGRAILIDALQTVGPEAHGDLPAAVYDEMLRRRAPFRHVPLVLASHPHGDHFDPVTAAGFLRRHPESVLAAAGDVLERLRASGAGGAPLLRQARELRPAEGAAVAIGDVKITAFALPHIAPRMYADPVVAHLVEVGGKRILHLSDAELADGDVERLELGSRGIDLAIVPYWAFARERARERLQRLIGARRVAAMRLPAGGVEEARRTVQQAVPGAIVLARPMDSIRL